MSLTQVTMSDIIKKQYFFKLKAFIELFNPLILMQIIALFFSLGGVGQGGLGGDFSVSYYTTDFIIIFTAIWAFVIAIQLTTKPFRSQTTPFVSNYISTAFSDGLFLLTASIVGGILALSARYILLAIVRFIFKHDQVLGTNLSASFSEVIMGTIATIILIFLVSLIGYMIGSLVQYNKIFAVLIPAIAIGGFFYLFMSGNEAFLEIIYSIFGFYFFEENFFLFLIKIIVTSALAFSIAFKVSSRLEVA